MDLLSLVKDLLFQKEITRIHFLSEQDEENVIGILALGENDFNIYINQNYGLTSENRLRLLDKSK